MTMEGFRNFLESSTIHGLTYISTTKRLIKLFWILVVIGGFTGAGVLIYQSFQTWDESPVTTTVETSHIKDIKFPKVTVCPPKNTYTDLNYDLNMNENLTISSATRKKLNDYAVELLNKYLYERAIRNLSMLQDNNRYYNWYHGLTPVSLPFPIMDFDYFYAINTYATNGSIATQYFGETFDIEKIVPNVKYKVFFNIPKNAKSTLHLEIEKVTMTDLSSGLDQFSMTSSFGTDVKKANLRNFTEDFLTKNLAHVRVDVERIVSMEDVKKKSLEFMPGFKINWQYSDKEGASSYLGRKKRYSITLNTGTVINDPAIDMYKKKPPTKAFVRYSLLHYDLIDLGTL